MRLLARGFLREPKLPDDRRSVNQLLNTIV